MTPPPIALTMGDPAGVGGELTAAAWRHFQASTRFDDLAQNGVAFFAIDDPDRLRAQGAPVREIAAPSEAATVFADALPVLPERLPAPANPGTPNAANAAATVRSIDRAVELAMSGDAGAVTTNPINKAALYDGVAFAYPGHTEYLAALAGVERTVMMLAGPQLRVVPVTIHIALERVQNALTPELLEETLRIVDQSMRSDFGVDAPRIAVAGLNPHAGEGGAMGREEIEVIAPTMERLRAEGMTLLGPRSADTMFHGRAREGYDVAVCMYHDQALIPIKTLDFDRGVNVTLGLPFIRTSPDHGTAYDIAGQGVADATSLIEAITLAADLAARRRAGGR